MSEIDCNEKRIDKILEKWRNMPFKSISDSEIEELIEDLHKANRTISLPMLYLPENVTEFFRNFNCQHCGECCVGGGRGVFLLPDDIERLSMAMQISKRRFKDKFTIVTEGQRHLPFPCPFYNSNSHLCIVYQSRPLVCQLFPLSSPKKPATEEHVSKATKKVPLIAVSARCPEARKIACQLIKIQRDASSFHKKL